MEWLTPLGLPVMQPYHKLFTEEVKLALNGKMVNIDIIVASSGWEVYVVQVAAIRGGEGRGGEIVNTTVHM